MGFLITGYWYQGTAHKLGINLTDAQLQQAITKAKTQSGIKTAAAYKTFLSTSGYTADDIAFRIRISTIFSKLLKRHPTAVSNAEIASYYAAHKSSYGSAEKLNLRIVLAKTQANANAAKAALQSGQSWDAVAKKYSIDPTTKDTGGLLKGITAKQEDAALSKAAFAAPLNQLQGPVKGQFGYYVFEVLKKTPATQETLAQATAAIKKTLTTQKQTAAEAAVNKLASGQWKSSTVCSQAVRDHRLRQLRQAEGAGRRPTAPTTTPAPTVTSKTPHQEEVGRPRSPRRRAQAPRSKWPTTPGRRPTPRPRSHGWTRSPTGCGASARGTASRTSGRSCPHTVEEAYELADAAERGDDAKLLDELGDVLFQVHFLSLLLQERGAGDLAAVARHVTEKLIRRHPHVFGETEVADAGEVLRNWDQIKRTEAGREPGIFGEVPENLPGAAARAQAAAPGRRDRL